MAGFTGRRPISQRSELMGGIKIGAVIFDPVERSFTSITRMAVGFNGSFNHYFTRKVGLNAGVNLLMPVLDVEGFVWWSPSSGLNVGLSSSTPFVQFSFVTGLSFRLWFPREAPAATASRLHAFGCRPSSSGNVSLMQYNGFQWL